MPGNRRTRSALLQQQLQYGLHGGGNSPIFSETVENSGAAVFRPSFWRTASRAHAPQSPPNSYLLQNVKLRRSYVFRKGAYGMDETENGVVGFTTGRSARRERLNMVWRLGGAAPTAGVWGQRVSLTLSNIRSAPRLKRSPTVAQVRKFPGSRIVWDLTNNSAMAGIETQPKFHRRSDN